MNLKQQLEAIKKFLKEQQIHDENKTNKKRDRLVNFIYSYEESDVKRYEGIEYKEKKFNDKSLKQKKIVDIANNISLFTEGEIEVLCKDIDSIEEFCNDCKRGVMTIDELEKETLELKNQFLGKTKGRTIY